MKRSCRLCLGEYEYRWVTKFEHGLQLCAKCHNVFIEITKNTIRDNLA
jgi:hypothetical protein